MPRRAFGLAITCLLVLLVLLARLYALHIVHGPRLAEAGVAQRARELAVAPDRGHIVDRHGLPLAGPELRLDLVLFPGGKAEPSAAAEQLAARLGVERATVVAAFASAEPTVIKAGLTSGEVLSLATVIDQVPGLQVIARQQREGASVMAQHVLGAIQDDGSGAGIEAELDQYLAGAAAPVIAAFVDGNNRLIPGLGLTYREQAHAHGFDAYLTISAPWQQAAEAALSAAGTAGAIVVVDTATGDILAMASAPNPPVSYLNHALLAYAPGSLFDLVVETVALSGGSMQPDGDEEEPEAAIDAEALLDTATRLGFGQRHDVGLPGEATGSLPTFPELQPGDIAQMVVGQGPLAVTPLQVAGMFAAIGHGGQLPPLRLVQEVRNEAGVVVWRPAARQPREAIGASVAQQLRQALRAATVADGDSATHVSGVWTAGKAGTAEAFDPETGEPVLHAWFGGLADLPPAYGSRRLAIVVFLVDGGGTSNPAEPLFAHVLREALGLSGETQ